MLNISKTCHYALKALLYLAGNKKNSFVKIKEVAREQNIPYNFLSKIFQMLAKKNLVESQLGPKGGVRLSLNFPRSTLAEVISVIDGRLNLEECLLFGDKRCPGFRRCPIRAECRNIRMKISSRLKNVKLGSYFFALNY